MTAPSLILLNRGAPDPRVSRVIRGQVAVATTPGKVRRVRLRPADPPATESAVRAIERADLVVLGPGSWFSSVLPHVLVPDLFAALAATAARKVLVLNLGPEPGETAAVVREALRLGYRAVDTAAAYRNERGVGEAVRECPDYVFVTTKLWNADHGYDEALRAHDKSLERLGIERIDLYLIHAPWPWSAIGSDHRAGNIEVWKVFEELYSSGRARSGARKGSQAAWAASVVMSRKVVPTCMTLRPVSNFSAIA